MWLLKTKTAKRLDKIEEDIAMLCKVMRLRGYGAATAIYTEAIDKTVDDLGMTVDNIKEALLGLQEDQDKILKSIGKITVGVSE